MNSTDLTHQSQLSWGVPLVIQLGQQYNYACFVWSAWSNVKLALDENVNEWHSGKCRIQFFWSLTLARDWKSAFASNVLILTTLFIICL